MSFENFNKKYLAPEKVLEQVEAYKASGGGFGIIGKDTFYPKPKENKSKNILALVFVSVIAYFIFKK